MIKSILSVALVGLLITTVGVNPAFASSKEEKEARVIEKIKGGISKLGTGEAAHVEVKLRDKTELKGYIGEAGEDNFVVVDAKTGASTRVAYWQVKQVKGNNLSSGAKIAIHIGIGLAIIFLVALTTR